MAVTKKTIVARKVAGYIARTVLGIIYPDLMHTIPSSNLILASFTCRRKAREDNDRIESI